MSAKRRRYAQISTNLCNFPLARDIRAKQRWKRIKGKTLVHCYLPGDNISFVLPSSFDPRRVPEGFDTDVLFWLLSEARMRGSSIVTLPSRSKMLRDLGLGTDDANIRKVKDSLRLWACVTTKIQRWHYVGEPKARAKRLKPPIKNLSFGKPGIQVELDSSWLEDSDKFFRKVSMPLPTRASVQNLILVIWGNKRWHDRTGRNSDLEILDWRSIRSLCLTLGLNHARRYEHLELAIMAASEWFEDRGYSLHSIKTTGSPRRKIAFLLSKIQPINPTLEPEQLIERPMRAMRSPRTAIEKQGKQLVLEASKPQHRRLIGALTEEGRNISVWQYADGVIEDTHE